MVVNVEFREIIDISTTKLFVETVTGNFRDPLCLLIIIYELLLLLYPYLCSVNRPFAEKDHVACLRRGLYDEFFVHFSIHHALGHLKV
jgi:hypothetical protein